MVETDTIRNPSAEETTPASQLHPLDDLRAFASVAANPYIAALGIQGPQRLDHLVTIARRANDLTDTERSNVNEQIQLVLLLYQATIHDLKQVWYILAKFEKGSAYLKSMSSKKKPFCCY